MVEPAAEQGAIGEPCRHDHPPDLTLDPQGYLTAAASTPGRYNGDALDVCVLIKQALDAGLSLQRAVALARAYLTAETLAQPDARTIPPTVLPAVAEHLRAAEASLAAVRQVVEALAPPERAPDERVARRDE